MAESAVAPAAGLPLAERADFVVEACSVFEQAAKLSRAKGLGRQALVSAAAVQSCTLLLNGMAEVLQVLPTLPATDHQAEASLTQQALMLLGKVCWQAARAWQGGRFAFSKLVHKCGRVLLHPMLLTTVYKTWYVML